MAININCTVDSGYGYSLGISNIKEVVISNFIKKISKENAFTLSYKIKGLDENGLIIKYENDYYVMGDLAIKADRTLKRHAINDRVGNTNHLIEILGTLGLLCNTRFFNCNLVVGLPNKLRYEKDNMADWLKNRWLFSYIVDGEEIKRIISINTVAVVEQPVGAIYNIEQEELEKMNVISCDIGHGTADCCLMTEGILSINNRDWISLDGVIKCYNALDSMLLHEYREEYGIYNIPEKDLQLAIETGVFKIKQDIKDVSNMLNKVLDDYAEYIAVEIADKYADYLVNADYVIGSGGIMNNDHFKKQLTKNLEKNKVQFAFFDDPQKSVAKGMFNIANVLFEDDFNSSDEEENKEIESNNKTDVIENGEK